MQSVNGLSSFKGLLIDNIPIFFFSYYNRKNNPTGFKIPIGESENFTQYTDILSNFCLKECIDTLLSGPSSFTIIQSSSTLRQVAASF